MEKNEKTTKILAIVALLISVAGVSLGFAAFSSTIQVVANANVTPNATVYKGSTLSLNSDNVLTGSFIATTVGGATADNATLSETGISNISVHFTEPGQSATYSFYGLNNTAFITYLNSVAFGTKSCTPGEGTTASYVAEACDDITMTISAGGESFTSSNSNVSNHGVAAGTNEPIAVTITYKSNGKTADGPFSVDFGTSSLTYGTVD